MGGNPEIGIPVRSRMWGKLESQASCGEENVCFGVGYAECLVLVGHLERAGTYI